MSESVIVFYQGDTLEQACQLTLDGTTPVDITGMTIACEIKHIKTGSTAALTVVIVDAVNGRFTLNATSENTATWRSGLWIGDVQYTNADDEVSSDGPIYFQIVGDITDAN